MSSTLPYVRLLQSRSRQNIYHYYLPRFIEASWQLATGRALFFELPRRLPRIAASHDQRVPMGRASFVRNHTSSTLVETPLLPTHTNHPNHHSEVPALKNPIRCTPSMFRSDTSQAHSRAGSSTPPRFCTWRLGPLIIIIIIAWLDRTQFAIRGTQRDFSLVPL